MLRLIVGDGMTIAAGERDVAGKYLGGTAVPEVLDVRFDWADVKEVEEEALMLEVV